MAYDKNEALAYALERLGPRAAIEGGPGYDKQIGVVKKGTWPPTFEPLVTAPTWTKAVKALDKLLDEAAEKAREN